MHRSLLALAAFAVLPCLASCNEEEPAALFADVAYQLRCRDCDPTGSDSPKRDFSVVDGQDGTSLSCSASGGRISLEISNPDFSFRIIKARPGKDPGNECEIRVSEGSGNEYRGGCKKIGGDGMNPCEVELTVSGSSFSGTVECRNILRNLNAIYERQVVAPGTVDEPAEISVEGCAGL
jgi:hypothetical protein